MRHISLITLFTLAATFAWSAKAPASAEARCMPMPDAISVYPETTQSLSLLPTFRVEGTGDLSVMLEDDEVLATFAFDVTTGKKSVVVSAHVISSHEGIGAQRSVLVQPTTKLPDGARVTLRYSTRGATKKLGTWHVSAEATHPPTSLDPVAISDMEYTAYGCGPSTSITFSLGDPPVRAMLVLATIKDKKGHTQSYPVLLAPNSPSLVLGRSMCRGHFTFSPDEIYHISLMGFDESGTPVKLHDSALSTRGPKP